MADEELLSIAEVARILGVAETTVARLIERQNLPATKASYGRKVSSDALDVWMAAQQVPPGELGHLT